MIIVSITNYRLVISQSHHQIPQCKLTLSAVGDLYIICIFCTRKVLFEVPSIPGSLGLQVNLSTKDVAQKKFKSLLEIM